MVSATGGVGPVPVTTNSANARMLALAADCVTV